VARTANAPKIRINIDHRSLGIALILPCFDGGREVSGGQQLSPRPGSWEERHGIRQHQEARMMDELGSERYEMVKHSMWLVHQ
jgi:hypothetical protein